ncbi:MAG: hypothetical protein QG622_3615 [Actinomycetota bacterium]|nr:hypothetical protein [Actinomycetota bacterium]
MTSMDVRYRPATVICAVALVVTGGLGGLGATTAHAATPPDIRGCHLTPSGAIPDRSDRRSCLQVTAKLSGAVAVHQRATLDITVRAAVARDDVSITADLPPNLRWVTPPSGATTGTRVSMDPRAKGTHHLARSSRSMTAGQTLHYQGLVEAVAPGTAEITVTASKNPSVERETGADAVFLTIGESPESSRLGIRTTAMTTAVPYTGPKPDIPPSPAGTKAMPVRATARPATQVTPPVSAEADAGGAAAVTAGTACATGTWNYVDSAGKSRPGASWTVEVWDDDGGPGNDLLATGQTGEKGEYKLCFTNSDEDGTRQDIYVMFLASTDAWRIQDPNGVTYGAQSVMISNVTDGSTKDFGAMQQGDSAYFRVGEAFKTIRDVWIITPGDCWDLRGTCDVIRVKWDPSSADGTYYAPDDNLLHLRAADPDTPYLVAHETAHAIMDDVYDHSWPSTACPETHYRSVASEPGCAWVEGFAEWLGDISIGDTRLENTSGWDNGDSTEGRVAGSLYDLWDSANDGTDRVGEGIDGIWKTFQDYNSGTFSAFWKNRRSGGVNVGNDALGALYQNAIDYGYKP